MQQLAQVEVAGGVARVTVHAADVDSARAQALGEYLTALVARVKGGRLEVDLSNVRSLCTTALGKLVALERRLRMVGARLALLEVAPEVYEAFEVTHLAAILDVREAA